MTLLENLSSPVLILCVSALFTHYMKLCCQLKRHTRRDIVTGLYNKTFFSRTIQNWINRGEEFVLFILDIDDFKSINDTYGHITGDKVILHLAESLKAICPKNTVISRFGGDEFVFALRNTTEEEYSEWLKKFQYLEYKHNKITIRYTVSIGVSKSDYFGTCEEVHFEADECLYKSKRMGKGRYTLSEYKKSA